MFPRQSRIEPAPLKEDLLPRSINRGVATLARLLLTSGSPYLMWVDVTSRRWTPDTFELFL